MSPVPHVHIPRRIFISHSGKQPWQIAMVKAIAARLRPSFEVFLDLEDIETSAQWRERVEGAVNACDAAVIVLTREVAASIWCRREVTILTSRADADLDAIVPIYCDVTPGMITGDDAWADWREAGIGEVQGESWGQVATPERLDELATTLDGAVDGGNDLVCRRAHALAPVLRDTPSQYLERSASLLGVEEGRRRVRTVTRGLCQLPLTSATLLPAIRPLVIERDSPLPAAAIRDVSLMRWVDEARADVVLEQLALPGRAPTDPRTPLATDCVDELATRSLVGLTSLLVEPVDRGYVTHVTVVPVPGRLPSADEPVEQIVRDVRLAIIDVVWDGSSSDLDGCLAAERRRADGDGATTVLDRWLRVRAGQGRPVVAVLQLGHGYTTAEVAAAQAALPAVTLVVPASSDVGDLPRCGMTNDEKDRLLDEMQDFLVALEGP